MGVHKGDLAFTALVIMLFVLSSQTSTTNMTVSSVCVHGSANHQASLAERERRCYRNGHSVQMKSSRGSPGE